MSLLISYVVNQHGLLTDLFSTCIITKNHINHIYEKSTLPEKRLLKKLNLNLKKNYKMKKLNKFKTLSAIIVGFLACGNLRADTVVNEIKNDKRFEKFFNDLYVGFFSFNISNPEKVEVEFEKLIVPLMQYYTNAPKEDKIKYQKTIAEIIKSMSQKDHSREALLRIVETLPKEMKRLMLSYIKSFKIKYYLKYKMRSSE